jgi:transcriptional regulator with XRE-family HTH domain
MIGQVLRDYRKRNKLRLEQLSAKLGMSSSMLSRIERGERFPSKEYMPKLAECLSWSLSEVVAVITQEKVMRSWTEVDVDGISKVIDLPYLSKGELERFATRERERFLKLVNKSRIEFPADRERIAEVLVNLKVRYVDGIEIENEKSKLFAGFFPPGFYYRGEDGVIVINNRSASDETHHITEETKIFHFLHEIGHALLHWRATSGPVQLHLFAPKDPLFCSAGGEYKPLEYQANYFASAFLMPKEELLNAICYADSVDLKKRTFSIVPGVHQCVAACARMRSGKGGIAWVAATRSMRNSQKEIPSL